MVKSKKDIIEFVAIPACRQMSPVEPARSWPGQRQTTVSTFRPPKGFRRHRFGATTPTWPLTTWWQAASTRPSNSFTTRWGWSTSSPTRLTSWNSSLGLRPPSRPSHSCRPSKYTSTGTGRRLGPREASRPGPSNWKTWFKSSNPLTSSPLAGNS